MNFPSLVKRYYKTLILIIVVVILYRHIIVDLVQDLWNNPDYSHGLVLPIVTLWLIWRRKEKLGSTESAPSNFGFLVLLGGLCVLFLGELGAELFLTRLSLLIILPGVVLIFFGWQHLRLLAFPLGLLLLAIPLPAVIFYQITFPLQLLASKLGASLLELFHLLLQWAANHGNGHIDPVCQSGGGGRIFP
jgi:exosortase